MTGTPEIDDYPEVAEAVAAGFGQIETGPDNADHAGPETQSNDRPDDQAAGLRSLVARATARSNEPADHPDPDTRAGDRDGLVVRHARPRRAGRAPVVAIASGKGGVGKSTIALNIATASRRACTLVDLDLGTANLDVMCGVSPSVRMESELFRASGPDLDRLTHYTTHGFGLVPGAAGVAGVANLDGIQRRKLLSAVQTLGDAGETVIADLGAGIGPAVIETVAASDLGLIVTTPDPSAIADAYAIIKCVVQHRGDPRPLRLGLVITMVSGRAEARATHARIDRVCKRFLGGSIPMLGLVRRDARVVQAARRREPLLARKAVGSAARDLRNLASLIETLAPIEGRASRQEWLANP